MIYTLLLIIWALVMIANNNTLLAMLSTQLLKGNKEPSLLTQLFMFLIRNPHFSILIAAVWVTPLLVLGSSVVAFILNLIFQKTN